jgi:predicted nicotinamide N-methyase
VVVAGRDLSLLRPRDSEALLDEKAFEREERLPYWAELWPSAVALARVVGARALRGARTLELGCGLGLASIAAALAGGRVLASDWSPEAVAFTRANARRNHVELEALVCGWGDPDALVDRGPWDLVIASDVLYERRNVELLVPLVRRLVGVGGELWVADPGRPPAAAFLDALDRDWQRSSRPDRQLPSVTVHRLRPRQGRT